MLNTDGSQMQFQSIDEMNRMILDGFQTMKEIINKPLKIVPDPFAPEQPSNPQQQGFARNDAENDTIKSGQVNF